MNYRNAFRLFISAAAIACAMSVVALTVNAQEKKEVKTSAAGQRSSGRDPFKKYQLVAKPPKAAPTKLEPPAIQARIERYRTQKAAAANAHVAAPKPTSALLLGEVQVTGIFHTPRGWSAMVEATPLTPKLSYVVYPGENFFDGQLVAIEEGRLVFRQDVVWSDGRREKTVQTKPLRESSLVQAMVANVSSAANSTTPTVEGDETKPSRQEIDTAIRQSKVLVGMVIDDVSKAWGDGHTSDVVVENGSTIQIWRYSRGEVYFRNGLVYKAVLLKN